MKRFYGFLSDMFYKLGMPKAAVYFMMMSLETVDVEPVVVSIAMTPPKVINETPRVIFEDKEAIASLQDFLFEEIAVVHNYKDVN